MRYFKHAFAVLLLAIATDWETGFARSDAIPDDPKPSDIQIRSATPLSARDSYTKKFRSYYSATRDYDFRRFITLFSSCAEAGDALCQYFLADGVAQWLLYDIYPRDKDYGPEFVRKWLRAASRDPSVYDFVTHDWAGSYNLGVLGFPKDKELYWCWGEVTNSNNDMSKPAVQARFDKCRTLEHKKYGANAPWLVD